MTKATLLEKLKEAVTEEEARALSADTVPHISRFNRGTILEMLRRTQCPDGEVPEERVTALKTTLENYLSVYLPDNRAAWKWIILTCAYLCFICEQPLHPQEMAHYTRTVVDGSIRYVCPLRSTEAGSTCAFCVCGAVS